MKKSQMPQTWLRFTDEGSEGEWRDKLTNRTVDFDSIPWRVASEPTGFIAENCSGTYILTNIQNIFLNSLGGVKSKLRCI